jgi:group I intron endonuclease
MFYIYRATNLKNNKIYIGVTGRRLVDRIKFHYLYAENRAKSTCKFAEALKEYPYHDWNWEIIDQAHDSSKAYQLEVYYIDKHNSYIEGYNSTIGGIGSHGRILSEETRKRISESNTGKEVSEETRKKLSEACKGRVLSEDDKKSKSIAARNRPCMSISGHKGIQAIKKNGEIVGWKAEFCVNRKNIVRLGRFNTLEEAIARRELAVKEFEETGTVLKPIP